MQQLSRRIDRLEAELARVVVDRSTFVRHQQTLARHLRRVLADNKQLRIDRHTLLRYIESSAPRLPETCR